jgi:predicted nucleotidyltransferase
MRLLVKMIFGSHLYGTAGPDSDTDFKGVFIPDRRDILLGRIPKTLSQHVIAKGADGKNTQGAVDDESYSLHYFMELALKGETAAIDMLHAPPTFWKAASTEWISLHDERHRFHTRKLSAFVGYARRQAAKYGLKGSRLAVVREMVEFLRGYPNTDRLGDVWENRPELEHMYTLEATAETNGERLLQICGKRFNERTPLRFVLDSLDKFSEEFGHRARMAERNEGVDWKAVSHALRAGYQLRALYRDGDFTFPLQEADFLRKVKAGEHHYTREVQPLLESLMSEVEYLAEASDLPAKPDRQWAEDFVANVSAKST